jgi:hypothetical protein
MTEHSINQVRDQAIADLDARRDHHLPLGERQAVWNALGPRATGRGRLSGPHRRRIALALAAAERVRPIWERRYPKNPLWRKVTATIGQVVRGELKLPAALERFDEYWAEITDLATNDPSPEIAAGFAIVQALGTAIVDEKFDPGAIDPKREDGDDPMDFDAAVYAESAEAGGMPWDDDANGDHRRAFWRWWLGEAARPTLDDAALKKL